PNATAKTLAIILLELLAIARRLEQFIALQIFLQVQRDFAGGKLLEDNKIDTVGIHLERARQRLPTEVGTEETVEQVGAKRGESRQPGIRLRVHQRNQRGAQLATQPQARRGKQEEQRIDLGIQVRRRLQDRLLTAQQAMQAAILAPARIHRRQRRRTMTITIDLVPRVGHARHAKQALVDAFLQQLFHALHFLLGRHHIGRYRTTEAKHRGTQV